ncbi:alpha/beta hydrolase [Kordiimonas pumila]|uniref:Alpha/beta hydrolase n=1 Tax=Kordiimonas pumila TaxID=2161677 RepID=A0ABV7D8J2_9PROT|nr:alpha/beta hydrolase-fold protein [Kordiimonas pumila]
MAITSYWKRFSLYLVTLCACLALTDVSTNAAPLTLENTSQFDITGTENGRIYRISVYSPKEQAPEEGFPVIYVTDSSQMFPLIIGPAARYAAGVKETPAVIVGIGYPETMEANKERAVDLTIPLPDENKQPEGTGGASSFLNFITHDLKPVIEKDHKINKQDQSLYGHSYGGLFALYTLFTATSEFQNYLISSPSIWFGNKHILTLKDQIRVQQNQRLRVLLTVGSHEDTPDRKILATRDNPEELKARMAEFAMVQNTINLAAELDSQLDTFEFHKLDGLSHMLAGRVAVIRAIPFVFDHFD